MGLKAKSEIIHQEECLSVERIMTPNGWLYVTRYWFEDRIAVAAAFAPPGLLVDEPVALR